jgi:ribulose 1,5-bisphosphate synthetase/thiazole synthase
MDRVVEERIAQNDATFRNANERIGAAAGAYDVKMPIPFICECADPTCMEIVRLDLDQYEEVRANSRHFLNIPGHETVAQGAAVVVSERDGYVIVEKTGHAGEVVEALDERNADEGLEQATAGEQ